MNKDDYQEAVAERIACQQILAEDHSVFSVQRLTLPPAVPCRISAPELLRLYLRYMERCTLGLISAGETADGVAFRLAGTSLALIRFAVPEYESGDGSDKTTLRICGGLLVQPLECGRGQLSFMVETLPVGTRLTLQLADYCPLILGRSRPSRLRKWLYQLTQAYIHKVVIVRFLRMVYRQLTGSTLADKTVMIVVRQGEDI